MGAPPLGGRVVWLIWCHFFLSCSWVSILSITAEQAESPFFSVAFCKSNKCFWRSVGASLASHNNWYCVIWMWIMTLLCDINLGSNRWERRQSLIRLWESGGSCPKTNFCTLASNHHRDNQKLIFGLHLYHSFCIWCSLIPGRVYIALVLNPNYSSDKQNPCWRDIQHDIIWSIFFHTSCVDCIANPACGCMSEQVMSIYNEATLRCIE